jgi:hypothetical protein
MAIVDMVNSARPGKANGSFVFNCHLSTRIDAWTKGTAGTHSGQNFWPANNSSSLHSNDLQTLLNERTALSSQAWYQECNTGSNHEILKQIADNNTQPG